MKKSLALAFVLAALTLSLTRCANNPTSSEEGPFTLTFSLTGMTPHVGQLMVVQVIDTTDGVAVADTDIAQVPSSNFSIHFGAILKQNHWYRIDFFADLNKNGLYDKPPVDHSWRIKIGKPRADTTVTFAHNTNFTDIGYEEEAMHSLKMTFKGMTPHVGQLLVINVIDTVYNTAVIDTDIAMVPADSFAVNLGKKLIDGRAYRIDFFADLNKNGEYDAPPVDHAWRIQLGTVTDDTIVKFVHNTTFTDIKYEQEAMDSLTMKFTDMTPHMGQLLVINVIDTAYGTVVIDTDIAKVPSAAFTIKLGRKLVDGRVYRIDFFADLNKNGQYDAPPVDHAWRIELGTVMGDTTVTFAHNTNFTDIDYEKEPVYSLAMDFTGMTPHIGQKLEIWLIDSLYNEVIRDTTLSAVPSATFSLDLGDPLVGGRTYLIDFFADLNGNGSYDPPPVDHAWRIGLPEVMKDTTVAFAHNTNFTDIGTH